MLSLNFYMRHLIRERIRHCGKNLTQVDKEVFGGKKYLMHVVRGLRSPSYSVVARLAPHLDSTPVALWNEARRRYSEQGECTI